MELFFYLSKQTFSGYSLLDVKSPPTITMINHLFCHTTVNTDVFTCDRTCFFRAKKQYHIGNIHGISHTMNRLLHCICSCIFGKVSIYPSRRDRIDSYSSCKADCQRMSQCWNSSAIVFPMPCAPPVTITTLFLNSI